MPAYSHIQTYIKCKEKNFSDILCHVANVLEGLGFDRHYIKENFSGLKWIESENGFMYTGCNAPAVNINLFGIFLKVRPIVLGWTPKIMKEITEPWLEISLLFETEDIIKDFQTFSLKDEVKNPLWTTMVVISNRFPETGVYLTDEITDGRPWEAYLGCHEDFWCFDAAIIPLAIINNNACVSDNYLSKEADKSLYFINKVAWGRTPW